MADQPQPQPQPHRVILTPETKAWSATLGDKQRHALGASFEALERYGPTLGRPLVERIKRSRIHKLKELRVPSSNVRVLFAFDSRRNAVMLAGGDKTNDWDRWYARNTPLAERRLAAHERRIGGEVRCQSPKTGARSLAR